MNVPYPSDTTAVEACCRSCGKAIIGGQSFWLNGRGPYDLDCLNKLSAPLESVPDHIKFAPMPRQLPNLPIEDIIRTELERQLKPYLTRAETIVVAARALVAKLDQVSDSPEFKGVFTVAAMHHCPYKGPQFGPELEALRAALAGGTNAISEPPAISSTTTSDNDQHTDQIRAS